MISFLKLEEHRNRKLEPLPENDTSELYYRSLDQALNAVLDWMRDEDILTVPCVQRPPPHAPSSSFSLSANRRANMGRDWLHAEDYSDPSEERNVTTVPSIDHKVRVR